MSKVKELIRRYEELNKDEQKEFLQTLLTKALFKKVSKEKEGQKK